MDKGKSREKCYPRKNPSARCNFCNSNVDNEIVYGPMYTLKSITCHYFCVLLSSRLVQRGDDNEGVLGFLHNDILDVLKYHKNVRCFYCKNTGATITCCSKTCRRIFHLPCGIQNGALFLFYNTFQSFCGMHRRDQTIPQHIISKRRFPVIKMKRLNLKKFKVVNKRYIVKGITNLPMRDPIISPPDPTDKCSICLESITPYPIHDTFWPPCCQANQWFHRKCLAQLALSAGEYFLRCPLCNNNKEFIDEILKFGIYIPSRDASWERERGAFSELLERPDSCQLESCRCPCGRKYNKSKQWEIIICNICGSEAAHRKCAAIDDDKYDCANCAQIVNKMEEIPQSSSSEAEAMDITDISIIESDAASNTDLNPTLASETSLYEEFQMCVDLTFDNQNSSIETEYSQNSPKKCAKSSNLKPEWSFFSRVISPNVKTRKRTHDISKTTIKLNTISKYFLHK